MYAGFGADESRTLGVRGIVARTGRDLDFVEGSRRQKEKLAVQRAFELHTIDFTASFPNVKNTYDNTANKLGHA